ncbi:MAG: metal-dependent transcriptional regulator [Promethearchaeota archaeon]
MKVDVNERKLRRESDVLRFLYHWERPIRPGDLARELGIKHQTVNSILKQLVGSGAITWEPYGSVELTESGRWVALHFDHHHNLFEHFLSDTLEIDDQDAHAEAKRIAPLVSCSLIEAICRKYGLSPSSPCKDRRYPESSQFCVEVRGFVGKHERLVGGR